MQKYRFQIPFNGTKEIFLELEIHNTVSFLFCWDRGTSKLESLELPYKLDEIENFITNLEVVQDVSFSEGVAVLLGFSLFKVCNSSDKIISDSKNVIGYIGKIKEYLDKPSIKYQDFYIDGLNEYLDRFRKLNVYRAEAEVGTIEVPLLEDGIGAHGKAKRSDFVFDDERNIIFFKGHMFDLTRSKDTYPRLKCLINEILRRRENPEMNLPDFLHGGDMVDIFQQANLETNKVQFLDVLRKSTRNKISDIITIKENKFFLV